LDPRPGDEVGEAEVGGRTSEEEEPVAERVGSSR